MQALIWKEVVPDLLVSATLPRWWNISANELHAVALYQRSGEKILAASVEDEQLRNKTLSILSIRMTPQRLEQTELAFRAGSAPRLCRQTTSTWLLDFTRHHPQQTLRHWGPPAMN